MKKIILTAAIVFGMVSANAQQIKLGLKTGMNLSSIANTVDKANDDDKLKFGYLVGAFAEINVSEQLAIQPELLYSAQGSKSVTDTDLLGIKTKTTTKINTSYLQIPVMIKYYVMDALALEVGPQFGFLMAAEADADVDIEGLGALGNAIGGAASGVTDAKPVDVKDAMNPLDISFNVGASYNVTDNLSLGARYSLGLTDTMDKELRGDSDDDKLTNRNIAITLGYSF